jgi:glycosyltransferase involved in cell wall biosynthesis
MSSSPLVSVVMSVFNGEQFLAEAVDSILNQSFRDFEFIVINDGSTDSSGAILDSYQKKDSRLRVYQQENRGLVESLNRGCSLAQGQYVARMDADDISLRDRLSWQVSWMGKHPEVGVVGGAVQIIGTKGKPKTTYRHPTANHEIRSKLPKFSPIWHPTAFMRTDVFISTGGYRALFRDAEDYDLWFRIAERAQLANLDLVVLKYRVHPGQVSRRKIEQQTLSILAVQAAAASRRNGNPDPLMSVKQITPGVLADLGVSEITQQRALATQYLRWIHNTSLLGERACVLKLWMDLLSNCKYLDKRETAHAQLAAAEFYWKQGRFLRSLLSAGHAVIKRPMILGRPGKLLWRWVRKALNVQNSLDAVGTD